MKFAGALVCAGALALVAVMADQQVPETHPQETQVQDAGTSYQETWDWCVGRFPYRTDLQEACQWGAYEMLPGQDVRVVSKTP